MLRKTQGRHSNIYPWMQFDKMSTVSNCWAKLEAARFSFPDPLIPTKHAKMVQDHLAPWLSIRVFYRDVR